jgi:cytochrome c5
MDTPEPEPQTAPATMEPAEDDAGAISTLDGKSLAIERCTACHAFSRVESVKKSPDGWTQTVQRMISKGAVLNSLEEQAVIKYLSDTYPQ